LKKNGLKTEPYLIILDDIALELPMN